MEQAARRHQRRHVALRAAEVGRLSGYDWPGNCRELQNVLERAVITAQGGRLNLELPALAPESARRPAGEDGPARILTDAEVRSLERQNTLSALERCHWRIYGPDGASELLRVRPTTLVSRLKKMGIARRDGKRGGGETA